MDSWNNPIFDDILSSFTQGKRSLSISEIASLSGHHRHTVARYMDSLLLSGKVEMRQHGQKKKYYLSDLQPESTLLNYSSHLLIILNTDLTIRWVNDTFLRMIGSTYEAINTLPIESLKLDLFFGSDLLSVIRSVSFGETRKIESGIEVDQKSATYLFTISSVSFIQDRPALVITGEDITEMRELQDTIRMSESNLRLITESVRDIIIRWDQNGIISYVSPACEILTGYVSHELIGRSVFAFIHDEDLPVIRKIFNLKPGKIGYSPVSFRFKNIRDEWIWFEMTTTPIKTESGEILDYITVWRNITERIKNQAALIEANQRLEYILEFFPDPIFVLDLNGNVTTWNYALEELTGIKKQSIIGKGNYEHSSVFYKKRNPVLADYIISRDDAVLSQYENQHIDGDIIRVDKQGLNPLTGKNVYLSLRAAPLYDINGMVIGAIETIRDISWRKEMEYEISRQTVIFEAVSCAASYILQSDSLDDCIFQTIQQIGEAAHVGIVSLFELNNQGSGLCGNLKYEWLNDDRRSKNTAYLNSKIWKERKVSVLSNVFSERKVHCSLTKDLSVEDRAILEPAGIRSILLVPILIKNDIWGAVGFLEDMYERIWGKKEIHALEIGASLIGSAIMRFKAGDALVRSEQQYRTLAHNIPGIVFRLSLTDSVMEYFNDHLEAVTGYTLQELTSGKFSSLIPLIYAEDKEQVVQDKANAIKTGESYDIKYRIVDKKGNIRFMNERGCPITDETGAVVGIDGIIQDIS